MVYLPGLDIAQHALLGSDQTGLAASTLAARLDAVKAYYSALDRLLAPFLTPAADELVIVVTEPGRVGEHGAARLSARGAAVRPHDVSSSAATAVAPTVLYALGIPISRDLPSARCWSSSTRSSPPGIPCATSRRMAGRRPLRPSRTGQPLDQEMIDRLRSLGYVR